MSLELPVYPYLLILLCDNIDYDCSNILLALFKANKASIISNKLQTKCTQAMSAKILFSHFILKVWKWLLPCVNMMYFGEPQK